MADITIETDDEMKAKAEVLLSSDYNATVANILPVSLPIEDDLTTDSYDEYDEIEIDDDEYSDYVSTPEGKALVERSYKQFENGEPITFTEDEWYSFFRECLLLSQEERQALHERVLAKNK